MDLKYAPLLGSHLRFGQAMLLSAAIRTFDRQPEACLPPLIEAAKLAFHGVFVNALARNMGLRSASLTLHAGR
jgi:hypothetical protein